MRLLSRGAAGADAVKIRRVPRGFGVLSDEALRECRNTKHRTTLSTTRDSRPCLALLTRVEGFVLPCSRSVPSCISSTAAHAHGSQRSIRCREGRSELFNAALNKRDPGADDRALDGSVLVEERGLSDG